MYIELIKKYFKIITILQIILIIVLTISLVVLNKNINKTFIKKTTPEEVKNINKKTNIDKSKNNQDQKYLVQKEAKNNTKDEKKSKEEMNKTKNLEINRIINFTYKLYNYNSKEEYKKNINDFFTKEDFVYYILEEQSIDNLKSYKSKNTEIYYNIDKTSVYAIFDNNFIYIPLLKRSDKYEVIFPHVIKGELNE